MKNRTYLKFGPKHRFAVEFAESSGIQLKPSKIGNQYDIFVNGVQVGFINAEELIVSKFPVLHFKNTDKSKIYLRDMSGNLIYDFPEVKDDDDESTNEMVEENPDETDDSTDTSTNDESKSEIEQFEEDCDNNKCIKFDTLYETIADKYDVEAGTEGAAEILEIAKAFPNFVGRVYAGKMKVSHLKKLYKVLCAVRDYHMDKPALAILKTNKAIIEAKKALVIIDFDKKRYTVKLFDADSKSGTVIHNAMLTHFGDFRRVDSIGFELYNGLTRKELGINIIPGYEHIMEPVCCNSDSDVQCCEPCDSESCVGTPIGCYAKSSNDSIANINPLTKEFLERYGNKMANVTGDRFLKLQSFWTNIMSNRMLSSDVAYEFEENGSYSYVIPVREGYIDFMMLGDFVKQFPCINAGCYILQNEVDERNQCFIIFTTAEDILADSFRQTSNPKHEGLAIHYRVGHFVDVSNALDFGLRMVR